MFNRKRVARNECRANNNLTAFVAGGQHHCTSIMAATGRDQRYSLTWNHVNSTLPVLGRTTMYGLVTRSSRTASFRDELQAVNWVLDRSFFVLNSESTHETRYATFVGCGVGNDRVLLVGRTTNTAVRISDSPCRVSITQRKPTGDWIRYVRRRPNVTISTSFTISLFLCERTEKQKWPPRSVSRENGGGDVIKKKLFQRGRPLIVDP